MSKVLTEYINCILEAMQTSSGASIAGYGLIISGNEIVLYDPSSFDKIKDESFYDIADNEDGIIGYIKYSGDKGSCGAHEILGIAAKKGFGPLMYDICMQITSDFIMPDRTAVSQDAKNIWMKYKNRKDIETKPLDSECFQHSDPDLNFKIRLLGSVNTQSLVYNDKSFMNKVEAAPEFKKAIVLAAVRYFDTVYK